MNYNFEPINIPEMREEVKKIKEVIHNEVLSKEEKFDQSFAMVRRLVNIGEVLSETLEKWNDQIVKSQLTYNKMPPVILDYIDTLIIAGQVKNAKDILALFEVGELKGIIGLDNEIDRNALSIFEAKQSKPKSVKKTKKVKPAKEQEPPQAPINTDSPPAPVTIEEEDLF